MQRGRLRIFHATLLPLLQAKIPSPGLSFAHQGEGVGRLARMYSTLQRLNHLSSLVTTYIMILLGLISIASFLTQPAVDIGKVDIKDLIM